MAKQITECEAMLLAARDWKASFVRSREKVREHPGFVSGEDAFKEFLLDCAIRYLQREEGGDMLEVRIDVAEGQIDTLLKER